MRVSAAAVKKAAPVAADELALERAASKARQSVKSDQAIERVRAWAEKRKRGRYGHQPSYVSPRRPPRSN